MSISLLSAVKAVPWGDVIAAAPGVVQGANALWERVGRKRTKDDVTGAVGETVADAPPDARIAALEGAVGELQKEALASSRLIRTLAEQNALLVREVEVLRLRSRILAIAGVGLLVFVGVAVVQLLMR
ncbi:MAG: hypothetical protein KKD25_01120 [Gammaproteobacteria bacterium]|jgi:hypothetical protein|nr:hypothetical protein [Gammaproteobacteria bacterium]MBU0773189.1 hypothetical protein [Gammaproteobacteria bacterium]MBU0855438.1 hypothetical protein [Gammaproteobacteria bacterium]MBU1848924.1 hypothetical protein [Gammaproteobacteria bacterium]